jgi:hypothetical protein
MAARIHGASTRILALSNLTIADGGEYSVMVTNASGFCRKRPRHADGEAVSARYSTSPVQSNGMLTLTWSAVPRAKLPTAIEAQPGLHHLE